MRVPFVSPPSPGHLFPLVPITSGRRRAPARRARRDAVQGRARTT
ncbi:hypothetical protein [Umezawaea sp.]